MQEVWEDIKGYEGIYQVSNLGRVKSFKWGRERILKLSIFRKYLIAELSKESKRKRYRVHRLVAEAFIPNPNNYKEINHKDENPNNNCVNNLEWCDRTYNINYGNRTQKASINKRKKIVQLSLNGDFIKVWNGAIDVEKELKMYSGNICSCLKNRRKTAYGYKWKYYEVEDE